MSKYSIESILNVGFAHSEQQASQIIKQRLYPFNIAPAFAGSYWVPASAGKGARVAAGEEVV